MQDTSMLFPQEPSFFNGREVEKLLQHAVNMNTSDITIQTGQPVVLDVHGRFHHATRRQMTQTEVDGMLAALFKNESAASRLNGGVALDFAFETPVDRDRRLRFRVNATACAVEGQTGTQITIRTIPGKPLDIEALGVESEILDNFAPKQGLILVAGATGSGKSTLLSAGIRRLLENKNAFNKILTYEAPIEFVYDEVDCGMSMVSQTEIPKHLGSFAEGVRNALRRKPTVILVGEARDAETIGECVTASMTGHLTYSTVHADGVAPCIRRMVNAFSPEEKNARAIDIVSSLKMIVSQMLVPSTDGKRVALREFLVFNENIVDELVSSGVETMTQTSRRLLMRHGQTFLMAAEKEHGLGRISDFELRRIAALTKGAQKDALSEGTK